MRFDLVPRSSREGLISRAAERGLRLSSSEAAMLIDSRERALRDTERIEFESGALEALIETFADSPHLDGAEVLCELTELFYHLKNETDDRVSDEALLRRMREVFDDCRGTVELLSDRLGGGLHG